MSNQRISADTDNLIKEIHGKKVIRKGYADGTENSQSKTGVKPGLRMFLQPPHISHGIKSCAHPQATGNESEYHGHRVCPQGNAQARQNLKNSIGKPVAGKYGTGKR